MSNRTDKNLQVYPTLKLVWRFFKGLVSRKILYTEPGSWNRSEKRGRSMAIRVVDCGSSGAAEQEILALFGPVYDAERFGFSLTASPRHADILLVSGPLTRNMETALLATFEAMPEPRRVVTIGNDIIGQGIFGDSYAVIPLPEIIAAACVAHVPGDPPAPSEILSALRKIAFCPE
jgi:Ni,Fe-hydrogenase III small subunit